MDGIIRAAGTSNSGAPPPAIDDDLQCPNHPYRNNAAASTGGICAFCLQEKLGKLVSSSSVFNASSSSPSFRSDPSAAANAASISLIPAPSAAVVDPPSSNGENEVYGCSSTNQTSTARRARIPFLLPHKKKKAVPDYSPSNLVLKRSKSAVAPRRRTSAADDFGSGNRKRGGFWSFLYHSKPKPEKTSSSSSSSARELKPAPQIASAPPPPAAPLQTLAPRNQQRAEYVVVDESVDNNNTTMSFGNKVSRSRSVGCGSRSFSGDFFERISGLGDCTLRRVESQRDGRRCSTGDVIHEKISCAGIFGGFMMTTSSSSYWLSAGEEHHVSGKESTAHGRSRSWGKALASPMRALTKPSPSSASTRDLKAAASKSNATPNLAAIPSLLTARG